VRSRAASVDAQAHAHRGWWAVTHCPAAADGRKPRTRTLASAAARRGQSPASGSRELVWLLLPLPNSRILRQDPGPSSDPLPCVLPPAMLSLLSPPPCHRP
jgi:hypothetical protein